MMKIMETSSLNTLILKLDDKSMENPGFDPGASSLLTTHSTDWASPPWTIASTFYFLKKKKIFLDS